MDEKLRPKEFPWFVRSLEIEPNPVLTVKTRSWRYRWPRQIENVFFYVFGKTISSCADESVCRPFGYSPCRTQQGSQTVSYIYIWFRSICVKHTLKQYRWNTTHRTGGRVYERYVELLSKRALNSIRSDGCLSENHVLDVTYSTFPFRARLSSMC